jgi:O-antigen/teichoic acid export membrane protein
MTPHALILTAGFALCAGVFMMPLVDQAYWSHVVMGCLAALATVIVGAVRRGKRWNPGDYA